MKIINVAIRTTLVVAFAFMASSFSCKLFDNVDDVTFDVDLKQDFTINEQDVTSGKAYSKTETVDATANSDFNKYKDKIKAITIKSVKYTVADYEADGVVVFTNGKGSFSAPGASVAPFATADLSFQDIAAAASGGQTFTLNIDQSGLDQISQYLKDVKSVAMTTSGNFSKTPVAFKVHVVISCSVTADAL